MVQVDGNGRPGLLLNRRRTLSPPAVILTLAPIYPHSMVSIAIELRESAVVAADVAHPDNVAGRAVVASCCQVGRDESVAGGAANASAGKVEVANSTRNIAVPAVAAVTASRNRVHGGGVAARRRQATIYCPGKGGVQTQFQILCGLSQNKKFEIEQVAHYCRWYTVYIDAGAQKFLKISAFHETH